MTGDRRPRLRLGITTPVVLQLPALAAEWERHAGPDELGQVAETADRLGYHHLTCSEHVAIPEAVAAQRGGVYWDPLATLSYLAARTRRIRLATSVLVLGYHHPLALAKRFGTLDVLSAGRLVLGVGVGTLEEEFALLGVPFADRGARADDALRALRTSLSEARPRYHGPYYDIDGLVVQPHAQQVRVPLWVGGRTRRSLRRAVDLADGWTPAMLRLDHIASMLAATDLPDGFEVVLGPRRRLDPLGDPDGARALLDEVAEAGATIAQVVFIHTSLAHYLDQLAAAAELFDLAGVDEQPAQPRRDTGTV